MVAFGDKTVREVMTPRPNIVAIEADKSLEDLRQLVINEQYSRIPVYEKTIDHIIGFVHVRDMFELEEEDRKHRTVRDIVRTMRFVPETKPVNDLLREMQQDRAHMAIVVDEYGNTAGLVTMEDLVEEVFGEIRDEHEPGLDVSQDTHGHYIVSGNFDVDRLEELMDFHPDGTTGIDYRRRAADGVAGPGAASGRVRGAGRNPDRGAGGQRSEGRAGARFEGGDGKSCLRKPASNRGLSPFWAGPTPANRRC